MSDDPVSNIPRQAYFNQQLLQVADFQREQDFALLFRMLSHRLLFTPGILFGLDVQPGDGAPTVALSPGAALDPAGRIVTLVDQASLGGQAVGVSGGVFVLRFDAPAFFMVGQRRTWRLSVAFDEAPVPGAQNQIRQVPALALTEVTSAHGALPTGAVALADVTVTATVPPPPQPSPEPPPPPVISVAVDRSVAAVTTLQARRVPPLDAVQLATGILDPDRLPHIPVSKIDGSVPIDWAHAPPMPASNIQGALAVDQVPDLPAPKIQGQLAPGQLPPIPAANIRGPLAVDQIPDLPAAKIQGPLSVDQVPSLPAAKIAGPLDVTQLPPIPAGLLTGTIPMECLPPQLQTARQTTIVDWYEFFPKGKQFEVQMSKDDPGPFPCPVGDIINPFDVFPPPGPDMMRWYRLKAVYYDEYAEGEQYVQIQFDMFTGQQIVFHLPQVCSGPGASNFRYSDWFLAKEIPAGHAHVFCQFFSQAPYDNHAGVYTLIMEAHDLPIDTVPPEFKGIGPTGYK